MVVSMRNVEQYAKWLYVLEMLKNTPDGCIYEKCGKICQVVVFMRNDKQKTIRKV